MRTLEPSSKMYHGYLIRATIALLICFAPVTAYPSLAETFGESAPTDHRAHLSRPELSLGRSPSYDYEIPLPGSYTLPSLGIAGDGKVLTTSAEERELQTLFDGRITLLSFIYTRCADPNACPLASGTLFQIHNLSQVDRSLSENLQLLTLSFDPAFDTPEVISAYQNAITTNASGQDAAPWTFITTRSSKDLAPILRSFGQRIDRKKNPLDPYGPYNHLLRVYLIDRNGKIRNIYGAGLLDPRLLLTDIRTLLIEEGNTHN